MSSVDSSVENLSPAQFAQVKGLSLSTVRRYLKRGLLSSIQPGGARCRVLIPRNALDSLPTGLNATAAGSDQAVSKASSLSTCDERPRLSGPTPRWLKQH